MDSEEGGGASMVAAGLLERLVDDGELAVIDEIIEASAGRDPGDAGVVSGPSACRVRAFHSRGDVVGSADGKSGLFERSVDR